jgi:hypothetical protein
MIRKEDVCLSILFIQAVMMPKRRVTLFCELGQNHAVQSLTSHGRLKVDNPALL